LTANVSEFPVAEYGCIGCALPYIQGEIAFWAMALSPFVLTIIVGFLAARRAQEPISVLRSMGLSLPAALPAGIILVLTGYDSLSGRITLALFFAIFWAVTFGPVLVVLTQWMHLEFMRIRHRSDP